MCRRAMNPAGRRGFCCGFTMGIQPALALPGREKVKLLALELESGKEYWLGLNNFYVITRYNRSPLYAMAVFQLAQLIREQQSGAAADAR